jgi:hypothetical protein
MKASTSPRPGGCLDTRNVASLPVGEQRVTFEEAIVAEESQNTFGPSAPTQRRSRQRGAKIVKSRSIGNRSEGCREREGNFHLCNTWRVKTV